MDKELAMKYYSRFEIQAAILKFAKNREIGARYSDYFGKRPDVIENISDVRILVKQGITSFHASEERWLNPLLLGDEKLSTEEKNKNKIGWDLILDLDGLDFEYSRIVAIIIIEFLDELEIKNVSIKFSGNKGFHIGVPFEAFSSKIGLEETRMMFPDIARKITAYLVHELKGKIAKAILEYNGSLEIIAKKHNFELADIIIQDKSCLNFDWMKLIEIDTVLISSRHLFRMPYSLNEKSGLVSIPVNAKKIKDFKKDDAKPENVNPQDYEKFEFLKYDSKYAKDADVLLLNTLDAENSEQGLDEVLKRYQKEKKGKERGIIFEGEETGEIFEINETVELKDFPMTIMYVLNNKFPDGKKRALFLLLTFLHSIKWEEKNIQNIVTEWNSKQDEPLKNNYIQAQYSWFKAKEKIISPPSFDNENYFYGIGISKELIEQDKTKFKPQIAKTPLHYIYLLLKKQNKNKPKETKSSSDKEIKEKNS